MIKIELPIYWKPSQKKRPVLMSMNWYRNAHYHVKSRAKGEYHAEINYQLSKLRHLPKFDKYRVSYEIIGKNAGSDPGNIVAIIEKYLLDALQDCGVLPEDNFNHHIGSMWINCGVNKNKPVIICTVEAA